MTEDFGGRPGIVRQLHSARGKRVWESRLGFGTFITMNFGGRRLNSAGALVGEYHLWVYGGSWVLRDSGRTLASCDDERATMSSAVAQLDGAIVRAVELGGNGIDLLVGFERDRLLTVERSNEPDMDDMELWMFFMPDGFVLSAFPDGRVTREQAG